LLADDAEGLPGFEFEYLKQPVQQLFKGEAGPVPVGVRGKPEEFLFQMREGQGALLLPV